MVEEDPDADFWLTSREVQVLTWIATGLSAKEIAKKLSIAPRTVERHIDHIRLKTRTKNRSHMVAYALAKGLIGCFVALILFQSTHFWPSLA